MAYYSIEPFGEYPAWMRAGVISATVANSSMNRRQGSQPLTPMEFVPDLTKRFREEEKQSIAEQSAQLRAIFESAKRKGLTKKKRE